MQRDLIRKTWSRIGYEWASMVRDGRGFRLTLFPKGFIEMSSAELWSKSAQGGLQWSSMTGEAIKYWLHRARSSQGEFFLFHRSGGASGRDERVRKRKRERERERERNALDSMKRRVARYWQSPAFFMSDTNITLAAVSYDAAYVIRPVFRTCSCIFLRASWNGFQIVAHNGRRASSRRETSVGTTVMKIQPDNELVRARTRYLVTDR